MLLNFPFYCPNCSKKYTKQTCYDKHKLLCCNNPITPNTPLPIINPLQDLSGNAAIEAARSPSILLQTVEELVKSNNILKLEIAELKKQAQTQKRKIPIIDILKKNFTPAEDYNKYMNIKICREDLEIIFVHGLVVGIQEIVQNQICSVEDNDCPLQAFDQKENKIYGYNEIHKWELISIENFDKIIIRITKSIMDEFKKWQDEHGTELYSDDFSAVYLENVKKVTGGKTTREKIHKKIYKNLYDYLKKNLTNIEYEFS